MVTQRYGVNTLPRLSRVVPNGNRVATLRVPAGVIADSDRVASLRNLSGMVTYSDVVPVAMVVVRWCAM